MPVRITKLRSGKCRVSTPNRVHAYGTSCRKARAQRRIIEEADRKKRRRAPRR